MCSECGKICAKCGKELTFDLLDRIYYHGDMKDWEACPDDVCIPEDLYYLGTKHYTLQSTSYGWGCNCGKVFKSYAKLRRHLRKKNKEN